MRTTLTLDKDVAAMVERLRKTRRQSMKSLINEALRQGLKSMVAPSRHPAAFRTVPADLGRCLVGNVDDVAEVVAATEGESFR
jgi:predicted transcriptional regulator